MNDPTTAGVVPSRRIPILGIVAFGGRVILYPGSAQVIGRINRAAAPDCRG